MTLVETLKSTIASLKAKLAAWKTRAVNAEARLPGKKFWQPEVERWRSLVVYWFNHFSQKRFGRDATPREIDMAMAIIRCESVGDQWAICGKEWVGTPPPGYDGSAETRASGLFQHVPAFWSDRSKAAGFEGRSIFDPQANVGTAAWLVYDGWYPQKAPNWQHWGGAHVGVEGCYEWALKQM